MTSPKPAGFSKAKQRSNACEAPSAETPCTVGRSQHGRQVTTGLKTLAPAQKVTIQPIAEFFPPKGKASCAQDNTVASSIRPEALLIGMNKHHARRMIQQKGGVANLTAREKTAVLHIPSNSLRAFIARKPDTPVDVLMDIAQLPGLNDTVLNALAENERSTNEILNLVIRHPQASDDTRTAARFQKLVNDTETA
ncbi:hypothetical protein JM93_00294 [Roseibium hamelinense]|uniref:Uncharacterized protein n=1 Tax=Roseibium hamelinense TaxID=150831 RepID=A0A562THU2_9HYPH|nr:hypothetical protein [Roseibium hamelinense]MTI46059.1 hypothetical protein [Roseibium hamelinense]TWI92748.1 hypothetical protein JM93_00294 [Roseibium hamelinense]